MGRLDRRPGLGDRLRVGEIADMDLGLGRAAGQEVGGRRLEPLAADAEGVNAGGPCRATARELLALLALDAGDRAGARGLYAKIADDREAPAGLRQRATQMLAALKE